MIEYLHIRNLAIVEDVEIEFVGGLNVITGETGAGKSILVEGMSLLRGGRAAARMLRAGAEQAQVEAVVRLPGEMAAEICPEGDQDAEPCDELVVSRVLARSGRSRIRVNGELGTVRSLSETMGRIVDLTGQREQQSIAEPTNHRKVLDRFGVPSVILDAYRRARKALLDICREWDDVSVDPDERRVRLEILQHQLDELEGAGLEPSEDEDLEAERRRLTSAVELKAALQDVVEELYESSGSVVDLLGSAEKTLERWGDVEPALMEKAERLVEARSLVEDVALDVRRLADVSEMDPARLEVVEERILFLSGLKRKHRVRSIEELLSKRDELAAQKASLEDFETRALDLDRRLERARADLERAARDLSEARRDAAQRLAESVNDHLSDLDMAGARFSVEITPLPPREGDDPRLSFGDRRAGQDGWDRVRFFVSTNPGEPANPVDQIASGGELSRLLLAIKSATAASDRVLVYVFDEVDQGVGGKVADVIGRKLAQVARHRQVLCVTHLPQIAAYGDRHLRVSKQVVGGRTRSSIEVLEGDERIEELARMSGGSEVSDQTLAHARDLLTKALSEKSDPQEDGGNVPGARRSSRKKVTAGARRSDGEPAKPAKSATSTKSVSKGKKRGKRRENGTR